MSEFSQFVHELADASGKVIRKYYRSKMTVEDKADDSPVTIADRKTEAVLRDMILAKYPDHDILGEEHGYVPTGSRWKWVLDPIDGTRSFIAGMPIFGTLISLLEDEIPQIGIIDIPIMYERWVGTRNKVSLFYSDQLNGKPQICKVSGQKKLKQSILYCADPAMFNPSQKLHFERIAAQVKMVRYGGDCYSYCLLASGYIDLVVEADLKIYDVMALVPVVENAGGVISDWQGNNSFDEDWDGCLFAAGSSKLHAQGLSLLQNI